MTADPHCHELSRQSPSLPTAPPRACGCDGAPACIGVNWHCRVSARQSGVEVGREHASDTHVEATAIGDIRQKWSLRVAPSRPSKTLNTPL